MDAECVVAWQRYGSCGRGVSIETLLRTRHCLLLPGAKTKDSSTAFASCNSASTASASRFAARLIFSCSNSLMRSKNRLSSRFCKMSGGVRPCCTGSVEPSL